ncbi:proline racemase family protein [Noviherbaspirillum denitrificans]|uniref:Uncharacterized protein n=1 Tax=Noviherbaspirillum denitrificans TaxID=1968433 RepID=A0A254TEY7_9BURK|nr:proline racemase family protein [Noviherbaspirillum denitrificans]OWW18228.1 hypothetical protein AYR66_02380 [Noviherbaspirillum denitrificans]
MISIIDTRADGARMRLVLEGGPDLGRGPLSKRAQCLLQWHEHFRVAVLADTRDTPGIAGALLCEPHAPGCSAGLIVFDSDGLLPLSGAGLVGLTLALARLGRIVAGRHRFETASGMVDVLLHGDGSVSIPGGRQGSAEGVYSPAAFSHAGISIHSYKSTERFLRPGQWKGRSRSCFRTAAVR